MKRNTDRDTDIVQINNLLIQIEDTIKEIEGGEAYPNKLWSDLTTLQTDVFGGNFHEFIYPFVVIAMKFEEILSSQTVRDELKKPSSHSKAPLGPIKVRPKIAKKLPPGTVEPYEAPEAPHEIVRSPPLDLTNLSDDIKRTMAREAARMASVAIKLANGSQPSEYSQQSMDAWERANRRFVIYDPEGAIRNAQEVADYAITKKSPFARTTTPLEDFAIKVWNERFDEVFAVNSDLVSKLLKNSNSHSKALRSFMREKKATLARKVGERMFRSLAKPSQG